MAEKNRGRWTSKQINGAGRLDLPRQLGKPLANKLVVLFAFAFLFAFALWGALALTHGAGCVIYM